MRFLILVKANAETEAGTKPEEPLLAALASYHEDLAKAGVLLDAAGLRPSRQGWRIRYSGGRRTWIDGPFEASGDLVAGYTLIEVKSREEAMEWSRRFPSPFGDAVNGEIEVRPLDDDLEDIHAADAIERFRALS